MPLDATGYLEPQTQTDRDLAVLRAAREGIATPGANKECERPDCPRQNLLKEKSP